MSLESVWRDFPQGDKEIRKLLRPGILLLSYVQDIAPHKKMKRQVIVGKTGDESSIATVYVNSKINLKYCKKSELQLKLEAKGRDYLHHDSYVDCEKLTERETEKLIEYLKKSEKKCYCEIAPEDLKRIKETLCTSPVPDEKIEEYGLKTK